MKFESKYDVGQKLWEIEKVELFADGAVYSRRWIISNLEWEIFGVNIRHGSVTYDLCSDCDSHATIQESSIGITYFLSWEEAMSRMIRLNNPFRRSNKK